MSKTIFFLSLAFLICGIAAGQEIDISGTVTENDTGIPIPGVTIIVKGTNNGTTTDFDGNYSISAPPDGVLSFSFLGYVDQEIAINRRTMIDLTMETEAAALDEVVVVGFGEQKKSSISSAVSEVDMSEVLGDRPITNAAQALQGAASGLNVNVNSGQPGSTGTSINIRGTTSLNGGSPLILINNVPGNISDLNPQDIESVSVLKDAAASAIYGARAAFGVVLITTKSASKNQPMRIDISSTTSVSSAREIPEKATTREFVEALEEFGEISYFAGQNINRWVELINRYETDPGSLNYVSDPVSGNNYPIILENGQYYPLGDSDIVDDFIDNFGFSTINNLTISGGSENISYRINGAYAYEDGVMVTTKDNFRKYNINALLNADLTENLRSTSNILYKSSQTSLPNSRYDEAIQLRMFDPTGFFEDESGLILPFASPGNIVRYSEPANATDDNLRLFQKLEYQPIERVTLTGEYTYEKNNYLYENVNNGQRYFSTFRFNPTTSEENALQNSSVFKGQTNRVYQGLNLYGKYENSFGNHNLELLLGFNKEGETSENFNASRNGLIDPATPTFNLAEGTNFNIRDSFYEWAVVGYFGKLDYDYDGKYIFQANLRYDGSSRFAKGNRYVWLPSGSVAWNVAKEGFMKNVNWISMLKPRVSYGVIGNQLTPNIGGGGQDYYPTIPGYERYTSEWINPNTGLRYISFLPAQLINDSFTWEEVRTTNVGLDLAFFKNRLSVSGELFERETIGMLDRAIQLPEVLGTEPPLQNAADLRTYGWEIEVGYTNKIGDFSYGLNLALWDNQTEIIRFQNDPLAISDYYEGAMVGDIWGFVTDGYYTVDDFVEGTLNADLSGSNRELRDGVVRIDGAPTPYPGDIKYKDLDGDGLIGYGNNTLIIELDENGNPVTNQNGLVTTGPGDRKIIGNTTKRYQFGMQGNLGYKGFDLSFVLNGVGKRDRWRGDGYDGDLLFPYRSGFDHIYKHQLDYWTPDNQEAFYPRIYGDASTGNIDSNYGRSRRVQTKYLSDESYLRIQNITLGYSLQADALKALNINKFRIFVAGNNIYTFDRLPPGLEPEQPTGGNLNNRYPIMAQYSLGFNVSF